MARQAAALFFVGLLGGACSDSSRGVGDAAAVDARPADGSTSIDAGPTPPFVGPVHELELLPPLDGLPYNHTNEVQIAVSGERVAVAYLNLRFVSADEFATDEDFIRTLGVAVSDDGGASFGPPAAPPFGRQTTDPNLRVDPDGLFWLATFDFDTIGMGGQGTIAHSADAEEWTAVVDDEDFGDKNWMAIDPQSGEVFVGAAAGWWRIADGVVTREPEGGAQFVGGYARDGAVAFTHVATGQISRWNGEAAPSAEDTPAPIGSTFFHTVSIPLGPTGDGGEWYLRSTGDTSAAPLKLLYRPDGGAGTDITVSDDDSITFLPAADVDSQHRLHIVYYDSKGAAGRVLYTHSLSSDLSAGLSDPMVIDENATPGSFFPDVDTPSGLRRLREYMDIQVAGSRAYIAWTHAPAAPSRVRATYVQFE